MNEKKCEELVFCADTLVCSFRLARKNGSVLLYGEETENGKTIFRLVLSFSLQQEREVKRFAHILSDSRTFPRMMAELAEDHFSCFPPK